MNHLNTIVMSFVTTELIYDIPNISFEISGNTKNMVVDVSGDKVAATYDVSINDLGQVENIQITDVGEWLTQNGIDSVQLMKINIEGGVLTCKCQL